MGLSTKRKQACFLPRAFQPRGSSEVVRLGSDNKGGHVVAADAVASTRNLLSLGLKPNFEFEIDFTAMAPLERLHGYDPDVDFDVLKRKRRRALIPFLESRPQRHKAIALFRDYSSLFVDRGENFAHFRSTIGADDGKPTLNDVLSAFGEEPGRTFLKCDIGAGAYEVLDTIIEVNALLSGFVLVLSDVPARLREIHVFLMAMREFMILDNMTADNSAGVNDEGVPLGLELSMSSRFRTEPHIPIAGATTRYKLLNEPNDPTRIDLEIIYIE